MKEQMDLNIDLMQIFKILKKHVVLLVTLLLLGTGIGAAKSTILKTPTYVASNQILILQEFSDPNRRAGSGDLNTNTQFIEVYKELILSTGFLETASKEFAGKYTPGQLRGMIALKTQLRSQFFTIEITSPDGKTSVEMSNKITEMFKKYANDIFERNDIYVISKANSYQTSPSTAAQDMAVFGAGAVLLGLLYIALLNLIDGKVRSEEFVEDLGWETLGNIPSLTEEEVKNTRISTRVSMNR